MADFNFKQAVNQHYADRVSATAPIPEVDAYMFCTSSKYLGEKLFPIQSLIIKLVYRLWKKYPITPEEQGILDTLKKNWYVDLNLEERSVDQVVEILILVLGRRSSKTATISFIQTYAVYSLICKGDPQKYYQIRNRNPIYIINCARDEKQAQGPFQLFKDNIQRIPFFQKYIDWSKNNESEIRLFTPADLYENEQIRKYNATARRKGEEKRALLEGSINVVASTTSAGSKRGKSIFLLIFDEYAHFDRAKFMAGGTTEEDIISEMPQTDYAMLKALAPATKDFVLPHRNIHDSLIVMISSPKEKGGEFYRHYCLAGGWEQANPQRDDRDPNYLMLQLASWEANPKIIRSMFDADFRKDPVGSTMEYGGHFGEASNTFVDSTKIDSMIHLELPMNTIGEFGHQYIITVDPATKGDTYAVAWGHAEPGANGWMYVVDGITGFRAKMVTNDVTGRAIKEPIDAAMVVDFISTLAQGISFNAILLEITFDQWNCLIDNELLFTEHGLVTIGELVKEGKPVTVATKEGTQKAVKFFSNGVRQVNKVTTRFGYNLTGTLNHPVWTPIGWKLIGDLHEGDKIAIKGPSLFAAQDSISESRAIMYGYLSSEGNCTGNTDAFDFCNINEELLDEYTDIVTKEFSGVNVRSYLYNKKFYSEKCDRKGNVITRDAARVHSKSTMNQLREDEVIGNSFDKRVPLPVRKGSKKIVSAYLSALYEGDGNVGGYVMKRARYKQTDVYIEYNTRSEQLAEDVHLLLLNLGIISSKITHTQVGKPCHRIMIRGENIEKFAASVGFRSTQKCTQLLTILKYRQEMDKFRCKKYTDADGIFWDTVVAIEDKGKQEVFDITVDEHHSFIANGIVTHNSSSSITHLRALGFPAVETFFTAKYKNEIYTNFLEKLNTGAVILRGGQPTRVLPGLPPLISGWVEQARLELKHLTKITSATQVTYAAPDTGPVQTDDCADVIANLIHRLVLYQTNDRQLMKELFKQTGRPIQRSLGISPSMNSNLFPTSRGNHGLAAGLSRIRR